ncbi:hypothetical protein M0R19_00090 [Candidatus Pacearchaeota archaeon]|jgi:hypothetical protein|nr:hypothetical protein [Candidatus Pacearchaeota archaeon]
MTNNLLNHSFKLESKFCHNCDGELNSLDELFDNLDFRKLQKNFGDNMGGKEFPRYACINCGTIYDKYCNTRDYSLTFLKRLVY